ncbi:Uncharacterised protein [Mycobacterium tuberculosis]|nr:Uncharacterised protein [Mycobacterium tuberculosis]
MHDEYRWLGPCAEFARILPPAQTTPPLVLRGQAPSSRLRAALAKGTRRALNLEEIALEIQAAKAVAESFQAASEVAVRSVHRLAGRQVEGRFVGGVPTGEFVAVTGRPVTVDASAGLFSDEIEPGLAVPGVEVGPGVRGVRRPGRPSSRSNRLAAACPHD